MASASLLINGMKPSLSSVDQQGNNCSRQKLIEADMEPFDAELLARVQSLHRDIEQKILEVTSLRRSNPVEASALFQQACNIPDDSMIEETPSNSTAPPPIEIPREHEIKDTFTQGMKLLKELKKGVPATSAKLERTKDVVTHVYS
jgi:kinetochor protein Mis14/NSL1